MSDIRKWLRIMESVPAIFPDQPKEEVLIKKDATVMVNPRVGGGTGRYMHSTPKGAMIDIKGVPRELSEDDFSIPERDYEDPYQKGNDWFHMSKEPDTIGSMNDKPEFRPGDMVKVADVYGAVIGPGMGVFVAYGTTGKDAIISFDNKEIVVPISNVAAALEQNSKDNFGQMDNDGNLSPMSRGSENVKIEQPSSGMSVQEPAMDQRDEFSKWISAVEEALHAENDEPIEESAPVNECGCGNWDCQVCFPDPAQQQGFDGASGLEFGGAPEMSGEEGVCPTCGHECTGHGEQPEMGGFDSGLEGDFEEVPMDGGFEGNFEFEEGDDPIADFIARGGQVQQLPYKNRPRNPGQSMGSKHLGTLTNPSGKRSNATGSAANVSVPGGRQVKPDVRAEEDGSAGGMGAGGMAQVEEEPMDFEQTEKPKSGKGVKLGDIVTKTEFKKTGGEESPLSYGDELEEDGESAQQMINSIQSMQNMGLSKDNQFYSDEDLKSYPPEELKACYGRVMGDVSEAEGGSKPTKTKSHSHLDDLEDLFAPKQDNLPAEIGGSDDEVEPAGDEDPMHLPTASRDTTQRSVGAMNPTDQMRHWANQINRNVGADEPERPETPQNAVTLRTANDVPAVISNALQAAGVANPEWHEIRNLPGMNDRNVRAMNRGLFSMMTRTPGDQIKTIANVEGQGPNTDEELNAVAAFLRDHAEDLGEVQVGHGEAIPGYAPQAHNYKANGVLFHVVSDPMGRYIYAWPAADTKQLGGGQGQAQGRLGGGGNMPRLRESTETVKLMPTLLEQLRWDEEIKEAMEEGMLDESTLSKLIGSQKGGQMLVRWLHKKHKLSNEAELIPAPFSERVFWTQFKRNPDDFVIVSAQDGVAGIKPSEEYIKHMQEKYAKKNKPYNPGKDPYLRYQIMAFTDDGEKIDPALLQQKPDDDKEERGDFATHDPTVIKARMGLHSGRDIQNPDNVFNLLANEIGALQTVYTSGFENVKDGPTPGGSVEREKMKKRAELKKTEDMPEEEAISAIFKRVRPILKTLAHQANSNITRRIQRYIEGGNFEGAQKLAASGHKLKQFLTTLDTTKDISLDAGYGSPTRDFAQAIRQSVSTAAGGRPGSPEYQQFLNGAAKGSAINLKPVLDSLRDKLVGL